jgi:pimeloyl-ACP methyl ester carboxylesterase
MTFTDHPSRSRAACFASALLSAASAVAVVIATTWSAPANAAQEEKLKIPSPQDVTLETKDELLLKCTWYAGGFLETTDGVKAKDGKQTVPIIMLHGWEGQRGDYDALASYLQKLGHACIVPDLRGHGGSTRFKSADAKPIDRDRMRAEDFGRMVGFDIEAVKKFLMEKNNAGEVNIELLCVIGAGDMGSVVAVNWLIQDWSWQQLPTFKQGEDAKALVLLSPDRSFKGLTMTQAINAAYGRGKRLLPISIMIAAGENDSSSMREAKTLHSTFLRFYPDPPPAQAVDKQSLFLVLPKTQLQGTALLDPKLPRDVNVSVQIAQFINLRLVNKQADYMWTLRVSPLGN